MSSLVELPLEGSDSSAVLVEIDPGDLPDEVVLASPEPGKSLGRLTTSLDEALDTVHPLLEKLRTRLVEAGPRDLTVEFGMKIGGETGIVIAKGTAEVNFKVTMAWKS